MSTTSRRSIFLKCKINNGNFISRDKNDCSKGLKRYIVWKGRKERKKKREREGMGQRGGCRGGGEKPGDIPNIISVYVSGKQNDSA